MEGRTIDGILLVDKPAGVTSHDVVNVARRGLGVRRVGHAGTLDPFATGLLVLLVGHATRLLPYIQGDPKVYDATIVFGTETDTDDATGTTIRRAELPDAGRVSAALPELTGVIDQVPPAYSAKQVGGRRAYAAARRGAPLTLEPARITVFEWTVREMRPDRLDATITCSGGTYIRALARDLGRLCGSAAHLAALRRTRSGSFVIGDAASLETVRAGSASPLDPCAAVAHLPAVVLSEVQVADVRHGRSVPTAAGVPTDGEPSVSALLNGTGRLVAIAQRAGETWQPRVVLPHA